MDTYGLLTPSGVGGSPPMTGLSFESYLALPLRLPKREVGVLFAVFRTGQAFNAPQKQLIRGLAIFSAIGMRNAQEFGTMSWRHTILQRVDYELSRMLELDDVLLSYFEAGERRHPEQMTP